MMYTQIHRTGNPRSCGRASTKYDIEIQRRLVALESSFFRIRTRERGKGEREKCL